MCLWFQQIIPTVLRFLRAGSCQTLRQTRPGPLLCRLLTLSETASDSLYVQSTSAWHPTLNPNIHCRSLWEDCWCKASWGAHVNKTIRSKDVCRAFRSCLFQSCWLEQEKETMNLWSVHFDIFFKRSAACWRCQTVNVWFNKWWQWWDENCRGHRVKCCCCRGDTLSQ